MTKTLIRSFGGTLLVAGLVGLAAHSSVSRSGIEGIWSGSDQSKIFRELRIALEDEKIWVEGIAMGDDGDPSELASEMHWDELRGIYKVTRGPGCVVELRPKQDRLKVDASPDCGVRYEALSGEYMKLRDQSVNPANLKKD